MTQADVTQSQTSFNSFLEKEKRRAYSLTSQDGKRREASVHCGSTKRERKRDYDQHCQDEGETREGSQSRDLDELVLTPAAEASRRLLQAAALWQLLSTLPPLPPSLHCPLRGWMPHLSLLKRMDN